MSYISDAKRTYLKRLMRIMVNSFAFGIASVPVLLIVFSVMGVTDPEYQKLMSYITALYIYLNYTLPETFKAAAKVHTSLERKHEDDPSDTSDDDLN